MNLNIMEDGPLYGKVTSGKLRPNPKNPDDTLMEKLFGKFYLYRKND